MVLSRQPVLAELENTRVECYLNGGRPAPGESVRGDGEKGCLELNGGGRLIPGKGPDDSDDSGEPQLELPWPESQKNKSEVNSKGFYGNNERKEKTITPLKKCVTRRDTFTHPWFVFSIPPKTPSNCKGIPSFMEKEM